MSNEVPKKSPEKATSCKKSDYLLKVFLWLVAHIDKFKLNTINALLKLKDALATESDETKRMLEIYLRFSRGKASKEEMETANDQFRDLLRALGLGVFAALPFAPVTIPVIVKLGKKLGIEILPSSFRSDQKTDKE
jgi:hypothetical protein